MTCKVIQEVRQKEHCKFICECHCVSALGCFNILSPRFPLHGKIGVANSADLEKVFDVFENVF